jgi:DNA-binding response OmpR family regulator
VLVVDDEPSIRLLCRVNLELGGYEVAEAGNGTEALARAREGEFGLVLLDVMMPDIGGHDVARLLAEDERTRGLPVVFLSARADRENLRLGYELGAVDYITKPFDPMQLAPRLTEAIERVERGDSERFRIERLAELRD